MACDGQCAAGVRSQCDAGSGYVRCDAEQRCTVPALAGAVVRRGTYQNPGDDAACATYIACNAGYYKRFSQGRVVECVPCLGNPPLSRFVTPGLSTNDNSSCLWECSYGTQQNIAWNASARACVAGTRLAAPPTHEAGEFGSKGAAATCPWGHTSEANTTLTAGGCLACPPPPANARPVPGATTRVCEWECLPSWTRRGARCVLAWRAGCDDAGWTLSSGGECVPSTVPWNRAGTRKVAPLVTVASAVGGGAWTSLATLAASSKAGAVSGRHTVTTGARTLTTAGRLCSMTLVWLGGRQYLIGAVCNQSFLAYADWAQGGQLGVLIGQASSPGWADGFRTQARFGTELYVAAGGGGNASTVWVLDRWNCVVREVALWAQPGDYRTRAYTVHGVTDRFPLTGQPKCYGPGSLASPRRFWEVGQGVLIFTDDNGLWQLELAGGALSAVMGEAWDLGLGFEADQLLGVQLVDATYTLLLGFRDGATWTVTAKTEACPDGTTSVAGGECSVGCEWRADGRGYFVNASSGGCVACDYGLQCAAGFEAVMCTRAEQARCRACPALPPTNYTGAYVVPGRCDADMVAYLAPNCPPGTYAGAGGVCVACPAAALGDLFRTATVLKGATRVEQCKCSATDGLRRRSDGACVSIRGGLLAYDGWCGGEGGCNVPPNATLWRDAGCLWRCDAGFYHDTEAPWLARCKPCTRVGSIEAGLAAGTRGDDDAPLSCEFVW